MSENTNRMVAYIGKPKPRRMRIIGRTESGDRFLLIFPRTIQCFDAAIVEVARWAENKRLKFDWSDAEAMTEEVVKQKHILQDEQCKGV
jgi:hypothetical protein